MTYPNVTAICCTYNRHYHLERVVKMFLDQDYKGDHLLLIYNNNPKEQRLDDFPIPSNKRILVINNHKDLKTGKAYTNLGAVYRDALSFVPRNTDILSHWDDDDSYLPWHLSSGARGLELAQDRDFKAFKPLYSFYRDIDWNVKWASNTMEPSIFVEASHVFHYGYRETTTDQHFGWLQPLIDNYWLYVDDSASPTMIYQWMGDVFKTSGNPANPENWQNCRNHKGSTGDGIITPVSDEEIRRWYDSGSD